MMTLHTLPHADQTTSLPSPPRRAFPFYSSSFIDLSKYARLRRAEFSSQLRTLLKTLKLSQMLLGKTMVTRGVIRSRSHFRRLMKGDPRLGWTKARVICVLDYIQQRAIYLLKAFKVPTRDLIQRPHVPVRVKHIPKHVKLPAPPRPPLMDTPAFRDLLDLAQREQDLFYEAIIAVKGKRMILTFGQLLIEHNLTRCKVAKEVASKLFNGPCKWTERKLILLPEWLEMSLEDLLAEVRKRSGTA